MWLDKLWEYKESISRPPVPDEAVAKVKDDIEYSNHLIKVHNVMNVLDLPNNQEEAFRESLTKQDDITLENLAKKSKKEILLFLTQSKSKEYKIITDSKDQQTLKNEQDIQKIKSVFTPQILERNPNLAKEFNNLDKEWSNKQEILNNILTLLKDDKILKSITEQLWWADKNNPKYLEFKNTLVWLDSWFDKYFQDLENINSWKSLNANEVIRWIEKDSWWMIDIDLNSNIPTSKLSLIWSHYSFDEEIDK